MLSRLKSLELHGYKTFASRTVFEFPGSITAIVGPNGSGKSNIADALRWVLGEQSYSLLRGRKTEDMIFSGSEQRPRASMASAAITFDNEDGWLPIDYSEVLLARRAYRDGQNEYVLNGQRVRLKEISELLAQSGLAERTYTIIGQGLVDAALSLKPEERRRFFEEAAGIGLYRSRREEALNRLEATRRNMERVLDILSELEPRLKSLERQAARANEYDRIKGELHALLREWYGYHWHRLQGELIHAREVLQVQEQKLDQARAKYEKVDMRIRELRESLAAVRERLNNWHSQSAEIHNQREQVNRALAVLDERHRALNEQQSTLQLDLARLEEEERLQRERLDAMLAERDRLQAELEEARAQAEKAKHELEERENSRGQLVINEKELRRKLLDNDTRRVQLKAHLDEVNSRLDLLHKNFAEAETTISLVEQTLQSAKSRLDTVRASLESNESKRQNLERVVGEYREQINVAEARRKQAQDDLDQITREKARLKAQVEALEQAENAWNGLNQGAKTVLQAVQQGRLSGRYHAISQLIGVPAEFEQAITAALGDALEGITLQESTDPEQVLELLSEGEQGRAILYPLAGLKSAGVLQAPPGPECLGVASQLVEVQDGARPVVDLLLGQVLVARDRKAARTLAALQPVDVRVVTLQGEVFSGSGVITAGRVNHSTLLSRPRQLREAKEALAALDQKSGLADTKVKDAVATVEKLRAAVENMEKELRDQEQQVQQAARALQQATLEFEQSRQKQNWQQDQIRSFRDQIQNSQTEIDEDEKRLKEIGDEAETLRLHLIEVQRELEGLPVAEFQSQVVHWNTQTALASRSLSDADHRLAEYRQALETSLELQQTYHMRLDQVQTAIEQYASEKAEQEKYESVLNSKIETLRQQIEPEEAELTRLESRYDTLQGDLAAAQQAVSVAERFATQAQLEAGRLRDSLESMRHRIEEDFGLVAFEYNPEISGPTPLPLEGMVQDLPKVVQITPELEDSINRLRSQLRRIGAINPEAQSEYLAVRERYNFLTGQVADLKKADEDLRQVINELDELMKTEFHKTFKEVAAEFSVLFTRLFGGGSASLVLLDEENPTEGGIDIEARLPGRREHGLSLLSGGERSLTAVALIFSLLKVSPTPFCVLDEVDAMLDEANVGRFGELLKELSQSTQFIVITHNRNTVQVADVIYGVTMGKDSASQVISLRLDEVPEEMIR